MAQEAGKPGRDPWVGAWLVAICVLVLAMILVGGATRLTDSGLSITEWRLDKGLTPPLNAARWAEEFALYQQTTEYRHQNRGMSLEEFQHIYWWEWGHRFLGKMIGLVFAAPFLVFLIQGRLRGRLGGLAILFALGALQGAIGWWMVTSGLAGRLDVAPERLAVHLGLALAILGFALWQALDALGWPRAPGESGAPRWAAWAFVGLLFVQMIFGGFMAGADGGPAYADWPTIGGEWIPQSYAALEPFARNLVENHAAQHLHHRTLGYVVALFALALAALAWRGGAGAARSTALCLGALALGQAGLGVAVVLGASPMGLSLAHQAGAAALWAVGIVLTRMGSIMLPLRQATETTRKSGAA